MSSRTFLAALCGALAAPWTDGGARTGGSLRVERIVNDNLANAHKVLELYEPFLFLLHEEERLSGPGEDGSPLESGVPAPPRPV